MSRGPAATTAGRARTIQRTPAPPLPRRVSGPAGPPRRDPNGAPPREHETKRPPRARIDAAALAYADAAVLPSPRPRTYAPPRPRTYPPPRRRAIAAPRPQRLAYGGVAFASRVAGVAVDVSASRFMDRVVRSRVWIGVIAVVLIGIVAMQVSLLKLNSGIGRAVQTASTLERSNAALRSEVSRLSAGDRIQPLAASKGLVMPAPADVDYLRAGDESAAARRAVQRMRAPDPATAGFGVNTTAPGLGPGALPDPDAATPGAATTTGTPGATAPAVPVTATSTGAAAAPPATATGAPVTATPPAGATAPVTAAPATGTPATTTGTAAGGAVPEQATAQTP